MDSLQTSSADSDNSITALLVQLTEGKQGAEDRLIPQVYDELRRLATHYMRLERGNHTLQPTALVHEAYPRLIQHQQIPWKSRAHFFAIASKIMRHILVDYGRARQASKRGGAQANVSLDEAMLASRERSIDVLALNEAPDQLNEFDSRQARIVELHFFGGLSFEDIGLVLNISERTAKRDWKMARAWLRDRLSSQL
jgi:RNA polymerase sigma-70 factor, ECF subfamily